MDGKAESETRRVVSALFKEYSNKKTPVSHVDAFPWGEEYIVLQPEIEVCITDRSDIDSAAIRRKGTNTLSEVTWYPHKNIFSFFMSANYSNFNRLRGCASYSTQVENSVGDCKLMVADTFFVKAVADFLSKNKGGLEEHRKKVKFLENKLKLFEARGGQVKFRPTTYTFHYSLFIDRIVCDHELKTAYVQYLFRNKSLEAHFVRENDAWALKRNMDVLRY